jgi:hypothetical protein
MAAAPYVELPRVGSGRIGELTAVEEVGVAGGGTVVR